MSNTNRIILGFVIFHIALLVVFVFLRFVDADEGFYMSAAHEVAQGRVPYVDFFFPQMPYLPAVQSFVAAPGFTTLYLGRLLGIIPAALTLLLFIRLTGIMTKDRRALTVAVGMYALSGLIIAWHSTAKTYAWTDFLLLITLWGVVRFGQSGASRWLFISAIALALAVNFRLVLAVALIPYAYCLWGNREKIRAVPLLVAIGAAIVVSIPTIYLFLRSPDQFLFDNFGFHQMRDPTLDTSEAIYQRIAVMGKLALNPQLWGVVGFLLLTVRRLRLSGFFVTNLKSYLQSPPGSAAVFAAIIFFVYVTPSPIHQQYFVQTIAFAILAGLPGIELLTSGQFKLRGRYHSRIWRGSVGVYILTLAVYLAVYLGAFRAENRPYARPQIRNLCQFIRSHPDAGPVFSEWAGIPLWSGKASVLGLEFVGFDYPLPISDSLKRYYHLPVNDDLKRLLRERVPAMYVVWNAPDEPLQRVADSNYIEARRFGKFVVYERRGTRSMDSQ
jgi:4-amino-4-deoxy-L-arabinose transferase-like glycosyltransferase